MTEKAAEAKRAYQKERRAQARTAGKKAAPVSKLSPEAAEAKRQYEKRWRAANADKIAANRERFYIRQAARAGTR